MWILLPLLLLLHAAHAKFDKGPLAKAAALTQLGGACGAIHTWKPHTHIALSQAGVMYLEALAQ